MFFLAFLLNVKLMATVRILDGSVPHRSCHRRVAELQILE